MLTGIYSHQPERLLTTGTASSSASPTILGTALRSTHCQWQRTWHLRPGQQLQAARYLS